LGTSGAGESLVVWVVASQFNLTTSHSGFKHWTIHAGLDNVFNRKPPFDPVWTFTYRGSYDPSLYSYTGRYGQVGAPYQF